MHDMPLPPPPYDLPHRAASHWLLPEGSDPDRSGWRASLQTLREGDLAPVVRLLARWGMASAAWLALEEEHLEGQAGALLEELRPAFLAERAAALAAQQALREGAAALDGAGIPFLVTQGAALLAAGTYRLEELRPMVDADVVVHADRLEAARAALERAGFRRENAGSIWTRGAGALDLHTRLIGMERIEARERALPLDPGEVWGTAVPCPGGDLPGSARMPDGPHRWVLGLAHAQKHSFTRLTWLMDLVLIARGLDRQGRERAADLTRELRLEGAWAVTAETAGRIWACPLPDELRPDPSSVRPGALRLARKAVVRVEGLEDPGWIGERMLWEMAPGTLDRALLVKESLFPRGEVMKTIYPGYRPLLRPFYLVRRVWDLGMLLAGRETGTRGPAG